MINLTDVPAPNIVEPLNFELILNDIINDFISRNPEFDAILESDPAVKVLEACAYRELILRARINHACQALMLVYASDSDLDQLAANVNVTRLIIDAGDPDSNPPRPLISESDSALKRRILLQFEIITGAGPKLSYIAHALSADASILDAYASNENKQGKIEPGNVFITVLDRDGITKPEVLDAVYEKCSAETVRPLCDTVITQSADQVEYRIQIQLVLNRQASFTQESAAARTRLEAYVTNEFMLGREITRAAIDVAAKTAGVHDVIIIAPSANVTCKKWQAPICTEIVISEGGYFE